MQIRKRGISVSPHAYAAIFTGLLKAPESALTPAVLDKARAIFVDWRTQFLAAEPTTLESFSALVAIPTNAYLSLLARIDARGELFACFHELPRDGPGRPDIVAHTVILRHLAMKPDAGSAKAALDIWDGLIGRDAARVDAIAAAAMLDALAAASGAEPGAALSFAASAFGLPRPRVFVSSVASFAPLRGPEPNSAAIESVLKLAARSGDDDLLRAWVGAVDERGVAISTPGLHAVFRSFLADAEAEPAQGASGACEA